MIKQAPHNTLLYPAAIILSFLIIITSCLLSYWPGLDGIFLVDDYPNLEALAYNGGVTDLASFKNFVFGNISGAGGRPIAMLSFLLNDQHWPSQAESFKYTNLMIHLLCGMLLLFLCYRFSMILLQDERQASFVSLLTCAIWLLHPFNVSTTLYVIQRMAQLATLFTVAGSLFYCHGRVLYEQNRKRGIIYMTTGVALFGLLATLSKENGVLLIVYILVIETTVFHNYRKDVLQKYWFWIFIYSPLAILFLYFAFNGFLVSSYNYRDFTLFERLLTENRILLDYLHSILVPHLFGNGLINDDIIISKGLFDPITTIFSIAINIALVVAALHFRKRQPVFSLAVLWFYGGHLLESTFISLELYFEHRNYTPMMGPLFAVVYYATVFSRSVDRKLVKITLLAFPVVIAIFSSVLTYKSSVAWSHPGSLFRIWAHEHPDSLRAQRIYGQFLAVNGKPQEAIPILENTYGKYPHDISLLLETMSIRCRYNLAPRHAMVDVENAVSTSKFTDGVVPITKSFVDTIVKGKCTSFNLDDAITLLGYIEKIKNINLNSNAYAQILFLHSDLYVLKKELAPAIELLDLAHKYQKNNPAVPIRQARLLASAGLYDEAIRYINIAKEVDRNRRPFTASKLAFLEEMEMKILEAKKQAS